MPRSRKPERVLRFWDSAPEDHLTLFKIPATLNLTAAPRIVAQKQTVQDEKLADTLITVPLRPRQHQRKTSITTLPAEILLEIAGHLHPVDRICLSLTSKTLLSYTLPALRSTPTDWLRFHYRRYSYLIPQTPNLYVRLADGWLPKDRFRYCSRCHKILPRCPEYFNQRLRKKRKPKFDRHVGYTGVTEKEWKSMGKRKRYAYLVEVWCRSSEESVRDIWCVGCCQKDRGGGSWSVHCPLCLERDLTSPRKPWFRKALKTYCRHFWLPVELLAYWSLFCCVWGVKFVYDQGKWCWETCAGLCCSGRRNS